MVAENTATAQKRAPLRALVRYSATPTQSSGAGAPYSRRPDCGAIHCRAWTSPGASAPHGRWSKVEMTATRARRVRNSDPCDARRRRLSAAIERATDRDQRREQNGAAERAGTAPLKAWLWSRRPSHFARGAAGILEIRPQPRGRRYRDDSDLPTPRPRGTPLADVRIWTQQRARLTDCPTRVLSLSEFTSVTTREC
jgi:hypothetical protein